MDTLSGRKRIGSVAAILLLVTLACNLPLPSVEPPPPTGVSQPASEPTRLPVAAAAEPILVAHLEPNFHLYSLDGTLLETRLAEGLDWARPNTAQVVGEDIFYVQNQGPEQGAVVRRVGTDQTQDLEFTRSPQGKSLAFAVSPDGARIAWSSTAWEGAAPVSQLWLADISGDEAQLVAETDPSDDINEWFVLEPVEWVEGGDLVYAWQVSGIGGYILFYGWSSLYRYSAASGGTTALAPVEEEVGAPCWNDLAFDGAHAVGACGSSAEVIELETASGVETPFPTLPDQGQAGAGAYSPSGAGLAYAVARGDPTNEAGQVVVRAERGAVPASIASVAPGYFERLIWVDEQRMAVGLWANDASTVELLGVDGSRSPIGDGRLVGIMRKPIDGTEGGLEDQLRSRQLELDQVTATGEIAAPGITVVVRNPGATDVDTRIPCGTIFAPSAGDDQELMVVQESVATVPAGGEAVLTPFVICIEADQSIPEAGASYAFSTMADGKLAELAACACQSDLEQSLSPMDPMGIQFAGWMVSEGSSLSDLLSSDTAGALGDLLGSDVAEALAGMAVLIEAPAQEWLDRCNLQP